MPRSNETGGFTVETPTPARRRGASVLMTVGLVGAVLTGEAGAQGHPAEGRQVAPVVAEDPGVVRSCIDPPKGVDRTLRGCRDAALDDLLDPVRAAAGAIYGGIKSNIQSDLRKLQEDLFGDDSSAVDSPERQAQQEQQVRESVDAFLAPERTAYLKEFAEDTGALILAIRGEPYISAMSEYSSVVIGEDGGPQIRIDRLDFADHSDGGDYIEVLYDFNDGTVGEVIGMGLSTNFFTEQRRTQRPEGCVRDRYAASVSFSDVGLDRPVALTYFAGALWTGLNRYQDIVDTPAEDNTLSEAQQLESMREIRRMLTGGYANDFVDETERALCFEF